MPKSKYSRQSHSVRFLIKVDNELQKFLIDNPNITKSEVIQNSVECFLFNKSCKAKRRLGQSQG